MSDLAALLERVKGAAGPDAQLDRDLTIALHDWSGFIQTPTYNVNEKMLGYTGTTTAPVLTFAAWPKPLTSSIDAALALVEKLLPRQWHDILCQALNDNYGDTERLRKLPLAIIARLLPALSPRQR